MSAPSRGATFKLAASFPFGPAFMSGAWRSDDERDPGLVSVLLTRALRDGTFVAVSCLVDRTCLGVKDAFAKGPMTRGELDALIARYEEHPDGIEEVSVLEAQSVVFHALAYAELLGFAPHRDFSAELVGPRPEALIDTPLAHPSRPRYSPGAYDDVARITRVLAKYRIDRALANRAEGGEGLMGSVVEIWLPHFQDLFPDDVADAYDEYMEGILGRAPDPERDGEVLREQATSLPGLWASFFRPMGDGRVGAELARAFGPLRGGAVGDAVDRLARARVLFGDVMALDRRAKLATVRDVFDGALFRVHVDASMARGLTRWTRIFGLVVELEDGTYYPPSTLSGHAWLRNVAPGDLVAGLNATLAALGHDERVDAAKPHAGLLRWVGVAHGVLHRSIAPTPAQAAELEKKLYIVNSDGDRLVPHEATILLDTDIESAIAVALAASDDFIREDAGFAMVGAPRGQGVFDADRENLASLWPVEPGVWRVLANSTERYERVLARVEALGGRSVEVSALERVRPWEVQPRVAAEESTETRRVVMASARIDAPTKRAAKAAARDIVLDAPFRAIDDDVPAVGGKPRDVVATPEGRAHVESWLMEWELGGMPGADGWAFVDLDPVRRELGLPTIGETTRRH